MAGMGSLGSSRPPRLAGRVIIALLPWMAAGVVLLLIILPFGFVIGNWDSFRYLLALYVLYPLRIFGVTDWVLGLFLALVLALITGLGWFAFRLARRRDRQTVRGSTNAK